jgi:hypothetical protein
LVAIDKFSKWIEAVPVTNQEATTAVKFFESIIYRYGEPNSIITNNGTNFTSGEFQESAKELGIKIKYASVAHPKSNGQVEKANRLVYAGLKKRLLRPLKRAAGAWVEELPSVLWSLRTTPNSSTGYTPLFLLFGENQCFLQMCVTVHLAWLLTSKKTHKLHWKMPSTYWVRLDMSPSLDQRSTSKASATTTVDGYVDGPSSLATLCFVSSKQARQSWSNHGKVHISSTKPSQEERIGYATPRQG